MIHLYTSIVAYTMKPILLSLAFALPSPEHLALNFPVTPVVTTTASDLSVSRRDNSSAVSSTNTHTNSGVAAILLTEDYRVAIAELSTTLVRAAYDEGTSTEAGRTLARIAHDEHERLGSTTTAIQKIAYRSPIKKLLSGADSANFKFLTESIAASESNIAALKTYLNGAEPTATSTILITKETIALESVLARITNFLGMYRTASATLFSR
ncbi:MAG: hypothetical protein JWN18_754 [Parcubacteria group bacterium]|nr:hypothetical protein [Parcubacteria group bacterium]